MFNIVQFGVVSHICHQICQKNQNNSCYPFGFFMFFMCFFHTGQFFLVRVYFWSLKQFYTSNCMTRTCITYNLLIALNQAHCLSCELYRLVWYCRCILGWKGTFLWSPLATICHRGGMIGVKQLHTLRDLNIGSSVN